MHLTSLTFLALTLVGQAVTQPGPTDTGLNFASWSSHMSRFPLETYCPETAPNPLESYVLSPRQKHLQHITPY